jgi:hypothetical protein
MDGAQALIGVVALALLVAGGAVAASYASVTSAEATALSENATSGAPGDEVVFPSSETDGAYYSDTATVFNGSTELQNGTDYTWNGTDGTLTVDSQAAANTTLTANYTIYERTTEQQSAAATLSSLFGALAYLPFVLMVALVLLAVGVFGGVS